MASEPTAARCWRCFHRLTGERECPLCGAAVADAPLDGHTVADDAEEAAPVDDVMIAEEVTGPTEADGADDVMGSEIAAPDPAALDELWADDHVASARWRRRALVVAAVGVAIVAILVLTWALVTRPDGPPRAAPPSTTTRPGPEADVDAAAAIRDFGHGLRTRAAGLAAAECTESLRTAELHCTFRAGRTLALATFRAIDGGVEGAALLEARLAGAASVSRAARTDGEAATFRLALGGGTAREVPWIAWYSTTAALYAEVSTTDEDPADLRAFYAEMAG